MTIEMKLNQLFSSREFVEEIGSLTTLNEIYGAVSPRIPELTKEELDTYLGRLSDEVNAHLAEELNDQDMSQVAGGVVLETLATAAAIITFSYGAGCAVGTAIKKWRSR